MNKVTIYAKSEEKRIFKNILEKNIKKNRADRKQEPKHDGRKRPNLVKTLFFTKEQQDVRIFLFFSPRNWQKDIFQSVFSIMSSYYLSIKHLFTSILHTSKFKNYLNKNKTNNETNSAK